MAKPDKHYNLISVLSKTPRLRVLCEKVSQLKHITELVSRYLDPRLAKNCQVANWDKGVLTLSTPSPAWRHHLRFYHMDLLKRLKQEKIFHALRSVKIIVTPKEMEPISPADYLLPTIPISEHSVEYMHTMAEYIDCPKLKAALLKLADHATERQPRAAGTRRFNAACTHHAAAHAPYYSPHAGSSSPPLGNTDIG